MATNLKNGQRAAATQPGVADPSSSSPDSLLSLIPRLDAPGLEEREARALITLLRARADATTWAYVAAKPAVVELLRDEVIKTTRDDLFDALHRNDAEHVTTTFARVAADGIVDACGGAFLSWCLATCATRSLDHSWRAIADLAEARGVELDVERYVRAVVTGASAEADSRIVARDVGGRLRENVRFGDRPIALEALLEWCATAIRRGAPELAGELAECARVALDCERARAQNPPAAAPAQPDDRPAKKRARASASLSASDDDDDDDDDDDESSNDDEGKRTFQHNKRSHTISDEHWRLGVRVGHVTTALATFALDRREKKSSTFVAQTLRVALKERGVSAARFGGHSTPLIIGVMECAFGDDAIARRADRVAYCLRLRK